jgi:hypothetical protein
MYSKEKADGKTPTNYRFMPPTWRGYGPLNTWMFLTDDINTVIKESLSTSNHC